MRTLTLRFVTPWLIAALVGCGSSSTETGATTTPTQTSTAASSGGTATTPVVPSAETAATTAVVPATTPAVTPAATPATTPETTPATPAATPPPADAATIARGHRAFTRACGNCHEENDPEGPSPNHNWEEARMRSQVRQGAGRMRAITVARLTDADLDAMIAFFRSTHAVR